MMKNKIKNIIKNWIYLTAFILTFYLIYTLMINTPWYVYCILVYISSAIVSWYQCLERKK